MKAIRVGGWVILALLTVVVVAAPLGPLPGLFIGGTPTAYGPQSSLENPRVPL